MNKVYTVVVLDRHTDPELHTYKTLHQAINHARSIAKQRCHPADGQSYSEHLFSDQERETGEHNLFALFRYSGEGDKVYVIMSDLHQSA